MHPSVLQALRCPSCLRSGLAENSVVFAVPELRPDLPLEAGVAMLGDREEIARFADRWPGGLTEAALQGRIFERRAAYAVGAGLSSVD